MTIISDVFAFRVDIWDAKGNSIVERVDDFEVAEAAYRAAVARWPAARITLRQASGWCMTPGNAPRPEPRISILLIARLTLSDDSASHALG